MGLFIITLLSVFDPGGMATAAIIAIPIIIFGLGLFYSPARLWILAAILPFVRIMFGDMGNNPTIAESRLYDLVMTLAPFAEGFAAVVLTITVILGFISKSSIGGPSITQILLENWKEYRNKC